MSAPQPRSVNFRREREEGWQELEGLVAQVEASGPRSLSPEEMMRLPMLYRAAISSLSVARSISLDRSLLDYLEALCGRAYLCVYGPKEGAGSVLLRFFARDFPAGVRALRRALLLTAALLVLGSVAGVFMTQRDPARFSSFVPVALQQGRGPLSTQEELREVLYHGEEQDDESLWVFSSYLFQHNARIGLAAFALGVLLGIPVVYLIFTTGLMLGAFTALHHSKGLGWEWWGWVLPHGITELLAVVLCGAAGLAVAQALLAPGERSRRAAVAARSREVSVVVMGAVVLFLLAGLIEGLFRQRVQTEWIRYTVAASSAVLWWVYFVWVGRERI